ncbi:MAG: maf [Ferruginibacter sp.]|nr:maf [Ferruginibacter sp.]
MQKIILASQSPRRSQLLSWAEVPFEVLVTGADESFPDGLSFEETAIHIARNKALAAKSLASGKLPVLAADTIVIWNNQVIGKPADRDDAIRILTSLAGSHHRVTTGVVILHEKKEIAFAETTEVSFHPLTKEQIEFYVDQYKPYDKAGAYAIQEWIGVVGIRSIQGDFYNVMGLPVSRVVQALQQLG